MSEAARIVNANIDRIEGTLRAVGSVDGHVTLEDGRRQSFHLDGTMFYLAPTYLRFDLEKLGDTQFLIGSNGERYWFYSKEDDAYRCGWHDAEDDLSADMPVEPGQLIDALGLTPIPTGPASFGLGEPVQRIVDQHQQILFLVQRDNDEMKLQKEFWLDRYPPRLTGRVVFRGADGAVEMESRLEDYRQLGADGPRLPYLLVADYPESQTHLRFRIRRWTVVPQVGPEGVQFATPRQCGDR
jgi:hypothetical protein